MTRRLTALGEPEGIDYRFDRALRVGTVDAHRLLSWAWASGGPAAQGPLKERLLRGYFTEGANVADPVVLAAFADEVGLDADAAGEVLVSGAFADEVATDLQMAVERQLTGVPAFVIEDRLVT